MADEEKAGELEMEQTGETTPGQRSLKPGEQSLKAEEIRSSREQATRAEALEPIRGLLRFLNSSIRSNKNGDTVTFNISKLQSVIPTRTSLRNLTNSLSKPSKRLADDNDSVSCNNDGDPNWNDSDPDDSYIADCQAD